MDWTTVDQNERHQCKGDILEWCVLHGPFLFMLIPGLSRRECVKLKRSVGSSFACL